MSCQIRKLEEIVSAGSGKAGYNQVFRVSRAGSDVRPPIRRLVDLPRARQAASHRS